MYWNFFLLETYWKFSKSGNYLTVFDFYQFENTANSTVSCHNTKYLCLLKTLEMKSYLVICTCMQTVLRVYFFHTG